jgi:predicted AAA+ superfamily ATPase
MLSIVTNAQRELPQVIRKSVEKNLREMNPWWRNEPMPPLPKFRRWAYEPVLHRLHNWPVSIVALRGPRQVGKSTLQDQIIATLLAEGVAGNRILRIQFDRLPKRLGLDTPILELSWWFQENILGESFASAQHAGRPAYLFFDELQILSHWAPQLKHLVDIHKVKVMITGSSSLRIAAGQDSLAGRITTIEMGPLFLREIATLRGLGELEPRLPPNGLAPLLEKKFWQELREYGEQHRATRDPAFALFSSRGAYPLAHINPDMPWEQLADQLNETIIRRVIQYDVIAEKKGRRRDALIFEEVFRAACRYAGQSPRPYLFIDEIKRALQLDVQQKKVLDYLDLLAESLLLRLIEPVELRLKRRRGHARICLSDHALRASWLQEVLPLTESELVAHPDYPVLAGHIAESIVGYFFSSILSLDIAHFPDREIEPEVDFVLTIGVQRIPVEIKYRRRIRFDDTYGLRSFIEKAAYNAPFGLLITLTDEKQNDDPRIVEMPLSTLLLLR